MDLINIFNEYTKNWIEEIDKDEWFFSKKRDFITANLKQNDAFDLISQAVYLVLLQRDENLCSEAFDLLMAIVRISNTTEMNNALIDNWEELIRHMSQFGEYQKEQTEELKKWYRKE